MGIALLAIGIVALITIIILVKKMLFICQPNEVLVFSGTHRRVGNRQVGYKPIRGGRKLKVPLIEVVDRMDLTNMAINVSVRGAFSHGGIPLNVDGVANLKVAGEEPLLANAVERLLGKTRQEIMAIAKETLEGNLRGVLAKLTPEQVNEDKLAFAKQLMDEADNDLNRLGLVLDTLKVQNVSDDVGYLDSIGRIKGAEIRRDAIIAEADSKAASVVKDASNVQETELVRIAAAIRTLEADTKRKVADAETQKAARVAEERGQIAAAVAEAQAEIDVQKARIEQVKRRLDADVLEPARADMEARRNDARGQAARIIEDGKATVDVLARITDAWKQAGPNARDVFLMQKLQGLVDTMTKTVEGVKVDKLTVLGMGQSGDLAPKVISAAEQIKATLGVDILGALQSRLPQAQAQAQAQPTPSRATGRPDVEVEAAPPPVPHPQR
jgi:flotillin